MALFWNLPWLLWNSSCFFWGGAWRQNLCLNKVMVDYDKCREYMEKLNIEAKCWLCFFILRTGSEFVLEEEASFCLRKQSIGYVKARPQHSLQARSEDKKIIRSKKVVALVWGVLCQDLNSLTFQLLLAADVEWILLKPGDGFLRPSTPTPF